MSVCIPNFVRKKNPLVLLSEYQHNAEKLVGKFIERQFDKFISNISNQKMVSYFVSAITGQLVKVIPLYQDEKPIVEINY